MTALLDAYSGWKTYPTDYRDARWSLAFTLRHLDGMTYREIGERFGVKGHRARQLVSLGERRVRQLLDPTTVRYLKELAHG